MQGTYQDDQPEHQAMLMRLLANESSEVQLFTGTLDVQQGRQVTQDVTLIAARSIAEGVRYYIGAQDYTGTLTIEKGVLMHRTVQVSGQSLLHSSRLTLHAFMQGYLGSWGQYVGLGRFITVCLFNQYCMVLLW